MRFSCKECGQELRLKPEAAGRIVLCRYCGEMVNVPHRKPTRSRTSSGELQTPPRLSKRKPEERKSKESPKIPIPNIREALGISSVGDLLLTILVFGLVAFLFVLTVMLVARGLVHPLAAIGFWMLCFAIGRVRHVLTLENPELALAFKYGWFVLPIYAVIRMDRFPIQAALSVVGGLMLAYGGYKSINATPEAKKAALAAARKEKKQRAEIVNAERDEKLNVSRIPLGIRLEPKGMDVSPDGRRAVCLVPLGNGKHGLVEVDLIAKTQKPMSLPAAVPDPVASGYLPDGRMFVVGNGKLHVFDETRRHILMEFWADYEKNAALSNWRISISQNPARPWMAISNSRRMIWVVDWQEQVVQTRIDGIFSEKYGMNAAVISPEGDRLLALSTLQCAMFSLPDGKPLSHQIRGGGASGCFVPGGRFLIMSTCYSAEGQPIVKLRADAVAKHFVVVPDGRLIGCSNSSSGPVWDFGKPSEWNSQSVASILHARPSEGIDFSPAINSLVLWERAQTGERNLLLIPWPVYPPD